MVALEVNFESLAAGFAADVVVDLTAELVTVGFVVTLVLATPLGALGLTGSLSGGELASLDVTILLLACIGIIESGLYLVEIVSENYGTIISNHVSF